MTPRTIMHVDGDGFFAGCEVSKNPRLRGKPVVTGAERGIVSACTYEAKWLGVKRGMILSEVRRICPQAVILPSDYETYSLFSERMYAIVRRYTDAVEEYGIDECFADITSWCQVHQLSHEALAQRIKCELETELGMTFSLGLSATKVLAKIGSKHSKPSGFVVIASDDTERFLTVTPTEKLWGVGRSNATALMKRGAKTALEFAKMDVHTVESHFSKPVVAVWHELNGRQAIPLDVEGRDSYQSISKTKTFTPPSKDPVWIYSQLSKNVENACIKARRWELAPARVMFFLKTQGFRYHSLEIVLSGPSNLPHDILRAIRTRFLSVYRRGELYRATGVTLFDLRNEHTTQLDLFCERESRAPVRRVYEEVDHLSARYGKHVVFLGSSMAAMLKAAHMGARAARSSRVPTFIGETERKRLAIPYLGEVS